MNYVPQQKVHLLGYDRLNQVWHGPLANEISGILEWVISSPGDPLTVLNQITPGSQIDQDMQEAEEHINPLNSFIRLKFEPSNGRLRLGCKSKKFPPLWRNHACNGENYLPAF